MLAPLAYFITFRTYGTWLHGDTRGSIDDRHNQHGTSYLPPDKLCEVRAAKRMKLPAMLLAADAQSVVNRTITQVCAFRMWQIHAIYVLRDHVHIVVTAPHHAPERVMNDLKAWSTRRLREHALVDAQAKVWSEHGSTK